MIDTIIFGGIIVASAYMTFKISRYGRRYIEDTVVTELNHNTDLQRKVKDMFGWR